MSDSILVSYATKYGSTQEVAEAIAATLGECGLTADLRPARDVRSLDGYGAVVLGAPLIMYRWHKDALTFLSRNRKSLADRPVAIFALGPIHDKEEEWQDSQAQLDKELAKVAWLEPVSLKLFGGKFDPEKLGFIVGKLAGSEPASDIRDWEAIRSWAQELAVMFEPVVA
ncbi:MAG: flavodoxin domain-containing protein [Chloroflexota bacterium]